MLEGRAEVASMLHVVHQRENTRLSLWPGRELMPRDSMGFIRALWSNGTLTIQASLHPVSSTQALGRGAGSDNSEQCLSIGPDPAMSAFSWPRMRVRALLLGSTSRQEVGLLHFQASVLPLDLEYLSPKSSLSSPSQSSSSP